MKAVVLHEVGGSARRSRRCPSRAAASIVDVRAAGINFADVLIRRGLYPQMPELPHVLGSEVAGELDGRRVLGLPRAAGGYAERVEVDPEWTFPLPDNASFAAGASFLHDLPDRVHPAAPAGARDAGDDRARARGLGRRRLRRDPAREAARRDRDRDGELRREAGVRARGGRRRGARLRRARRPACRRRARPGRWRGLHQLAGAAQSARRDRRDRVRGWSLDRSERAVARRPQRVGGRHLSRAPAEAGSPAFVRECALELLALWAQEQIDPVVGARFPLAEADAAHALDRVAPARGQGRASSREGARHRRRGRARPRDSRAARARGVRGRVARSRERVRRLRSSGLGTRDGRSISRVSTPACSPARATCAS